MIGIVGYGFVGQALGSVLFDPYHVVDPAYEHGISLDSLLTLNPSFIFICVPTPSNDDGCDDTLVLNYVRSLAYYNGTVVVKSSVPPSTVDKLLSIRPTTVIWPELLREATAKDDMKNPSVVVVGANEEFFQRTKQLIIEKTSISIQSSLIRHVTPVEASIFKYTTNSFLAMKVLFMHQMFTWCETRGNDWNNVADLLAIEGRVGHSHLRAPGVHGLGFDGSCFPKDTLALSKQAWKDGVDLTLLNQVIDINSKLRRK